MPADAADAMLFYYATRHYYDAIFITLMLPLMPLRFFFFFAMPLPDIIDVTLRRLRRHITLLMMPLSRLRCFAIILFSLIL